MVLRPHHNTGDSKIKKPIKNDEEPCVKNPLSIFQTGEKIENIMLDLTSKSRFFLYIPSMGWPYKKQNGGHSGDGMGNIRILLFLLKKHVTTMAANIKF